MKSTMRTAPAGYSWDSYVELSRRIRARPSPLRIIKGFRIVIPMKEMMINVGRSPSGQDYTDLMLRQNKILNNMLGAHIDFVIKGIDSKTRSVGASRREAMLKKATDFLSETDPAGMYRIYEGRIVQARIIAAVAEKVIRVEIFWRGMFDYGPGSGMGLGWRRP